MGDPKKIRKNYTRPSILWNEATLAHDKEIRKEYRTKNKKEIWKMNSFLGNIKDQAKSITSRLGTSRKERALLEKDLLIAKVKRLGLVNKEEVTLSDLLNLSLRDVMDRRLQTIVCKNKLARTVSQARQFIVHGHIKIGDKKITSPSYLVLVEEEDLVDFTDRSPMKNTSHPERGDVDPNIIIKQKEEKKAEEQKAKEAEAKDEEKSEESTDAAEVSDESSESAESNKDAEGTSEEATEGKEKSEDLEAEDIKKTEEEKSEEIKEKSE